VTWANSFIGQIDGSACLSVLPETFSASLTTALLNRRARIKRLEIDECLARRIRRIR